MPTYLKDPDAKLDYGFDWKAPSEDGGPWLANGETIVTSTWNVPIGITKESDSADDTETVIWLSGGVVGIEYKITNQIVTNAGRKDNRTMKIQVKER